MKKIIFTGLNVEQVSMYFELCLELGYHVSFLKQEDLNKTFQEVIDHVEHSNCDLQYEYSFMFISGLSQDELMNLLDLFNEAKLPFDGIKVMATSHNVKWTMKDIMEETIQEHKMMKKVYELDSLLRSCNEIPFDSLDESIKQDVMNEVMAAYVLMKSQNFTNENLDLAIHGLKEVLKLVSKS